MGKPFKGDNEPLTTMDYDKAVAVAKQKNREHAKEQANENKGN